MLLPTGLLAMPAPCCLRWALPRPPECLPKLCLLVIVLMTVPGGETRRGQCPLRRVEPSDGASRAYLAPQVLEAQLLSMVNSSSRVYEAIFYVTRTYKKYRGHGRVRKKQMVSLPYRRPGPPGRPRNECLAVADLKLRRKYFLFLSGAENSSEPIQNIAPPVPSTKKSKKRIRNVTCHQCAKAPSVRLLRGDTVVMGQSVNLTCVFEGNPSPVVTWYKNDQVIRPRRGGRIQIFTKRIRVRSRNRKSRFDRRIRRSRGENRRKMTSRGSAVRKRKKSKRKKGQRGKSVQVISVLSIKESRDFDTGSYLCSGKSVIGEASSKASLSIVPSIDPGIVFPCPYDSYCLNGGTCMFFKHFGEFVCQCADGYKGQRCQEKEVFPRFRDQNCRGSEPYFAASRGLRCTRNQPKFFWEFLQQSLSAKKYKVSPWSKARDLTWSPGQNPWKTWRQNLWRMPGQKYWKMSRQNPSIMQGGLRKNSTSESGVRRRGQLSLSPPIGSHFNSNSSNDKYSFVSPQSVIYQKLFSQLSARSKLDHHEVKDKKNKIASLAIDSKNSNNSEKRFHRPILPRIRHLARKKDKFSTQKKKMTTFRNQKRRGSLNRLPPTTRSSMISVHPTSRRSSYLYPTSIMPSVPTSFGERIQTRDYQTN